MGVGVQRHLESATLGILPYCHIVEESKISSHQGPDKNRTDSYRGANQTNCQPHANREPNLDFIKAWLGWSVGVETCSPYQGQRWDTSSTHHSLVFPTCQAQNVTNQNTPMIASLLQLFLGTKGVIINLTIASEDNRASKTVQSS